MVKHHYCSLADGCVWMKLAIVDLKVRHQWYAGSRSGMFALWVKIIIAPQGATYRDKVWNYFIDVPAWWVLDIFWCNHFSLLHFDSSTAGDPATHSPFKDSENHELYQQSGVVLWWLPIFVRPLAVAFWTNWRLLKESFWHPNSKKIQLFRIEGACNVERICPSTEPCGTPRQTSLQEEVLWVWTNCLIHLT